MCANYVFDYNRNLEYALTLTLGKVENIVLNAFSTYNFAEKRCSKLVEPFYYSVLKQLLDGLLQNRQGI